jgi:hypothetical protein
MLLYELISEARRNPGQNVKAEGHEAAVNFLKSKGKELRYYGVSMTDIPKLGINPGSRYNTPVGIYYYPAEYYVRKKSKGKELEFKDDAPYIQVFKIKANTIELIDEVNHDTYGGYVKLLYKNVGQIAKYINKSEKETYSLLNKLTMEAPQEAKVNSYGGCLWYILYSLGFYAGRDKRDNAPPRSSVVWNALIRMLGLDGIEDNGAGIIHENEPYQGVIVNPRGVEHVNTFKNVGKKDDTTSLRFTKWANAPINEFSIGNLADDVDEWDMQYSDKHRKECKAIMTKVLTVLRNSPSTYLSLGQRKIFSLLRLSNDTNVRQELAVGYFAAKFPRMKAELDEIVTVWEEEKNSVEWAAKPESRKQRAFALWVPPEKVAYAHEFMRNLTPYKSSSADAKKMIDYIEASLARLK